MHPFISLFGFPLPTYGLMIATGVVLANFIAWRILRRVRMPFDDLLLLEAYGLLGGFLGAKILYIVVSFKDIDWAHMSFGYFNQLMQSGMVFYGGLIGGLILFMLAGKIHHIEAAAYLNKAVAVVPLAHAFGRMGCFLAGCCYGIPYEGHMAVVFPENTLGLGGVGLFPVQAVEAAMLFGLALVLLVLQIKWDFKYVIEVYLVVYGVMRFALEYVRFDAARGAFAGLYTSQWIAIVMVILGAVLAVRKRKSQIGDEY